jgi:hypothetical protein
MLARPRSQRPMAANLVGSVRDRRHPHRRHSSASADGFSDAPGVFRVPVPILVRVQPRHCQRSTLETLTTYGLSSGRI